MPKNFVEEPFCVSESFCYRKLIGIREKGVSRFSVENVWSHSAEKFRLGTLRCIKKFRVWKIFMNQRGGGITFLHRKLFVTQYQKFPLGTTSMHQKISGLEDFYASERGWYHVSPSKTFCHTIPKISVGDYFDASENFGFRRILCIREGDGITFLHRKLFATQYRKISLRNTSVYQKVSGIEKFYASERGVSRFSVENFLSHSADKNRRTLRCFERFLVGKKFYG